MTSTDGGNERLVTVHNLGVADTSNLVVTVAQEHGYSVAATGLGQFRMIRQKRPVWAVVAAILTFPFLGVGLLFLLVKKTDTGTVAVFEERDGTKVRFVGAVDDAIVDSVTASTSRSAVERATPAGDNTARPGQDDQRKPSHGRPGQRDNHDGIQTTSVTPTPTTPAAQAPTPAPSPGALIDSTPIVKPAGDAPTPDDRDFERTVARSSLAPAPVAGAIIDLPDGRSIPVLDGVVIGRSPTSPNGSTTMQEVPYPDSSLSKTHLTITPAGAAVSVTDLHSTNGTTIVEGNARRTCRPGEPVGAVAGAEIRAGDVTIRIRTSL